MKLTADKERWLARGRPFCDWESKFSQCFESEDHAKELWNIHREKLMRREFQFRWLGCDSLDNKPGWRPWGFWKFEKPKEPRKTVFVGSPSAVNIQEWHREEEPDLLYLLRLGLLEKWEIEKFNNMDALERGRFGFYEPQTDAPVRKSNAEEEEAMGGNDF